MSSVPLACTNGKSNNVPNDKHVIPSLDQIGNGKPLQMALDMLDQLGPLHNNNNNNNNNNNKDLGPDTFEIQAINLSYKAPTQVSLGDQLTRFCKKLRVTSSSSNHGDIRATNDDSKDMQMYENVATNNNNNNNNNHHHHNNNNSNNRWIVKNVSFRAKAGQVLAIAGPSGAGKSTLLELLAGKIRPTSPAGSILVNRAPMNVAAFRRVSGYIPQSDALFPLLTVRETLLFSAQLRLPSCSAAASSSSCGAERERRVRSLMVELRLEHVGDSRIGNESVRGISGGERRRVSIGVDVIHDPAVLLLDEPTSGLDSASALNVVEMLHSMAKTRSRTIILSIHQPGYKIIQLLHSFLVLADGKVAHHGTLQSMQRELIASGHRIPPHVNALEYAIEAIASSSSSSSGYGLPPLPQKMQYITVVPGPVKKAVGARSVPLIDHLAMPHDDHPPNARVHNAMPVPVPGPAHPATMMPAFARGHLSEVAILSRRFAKNVFRTYELFTARTLQALFAGVALGTLYMNVGNNERGVAERLGFFAFTLTFLLSSTVEALPIFLQERQVFVRETSRGAYRISSYLVANFAIFVPFLLLLALLFTIPVYWLVGLNPEPEAFAFFVLIVWLVLLTANSFVAFFGALVPDYIMGNSIISGCMGAFFLFSGYFIAKQDMPPYWRFMHYISLFKYPLDGLLINEYNTGPFSDHKCFGPMLPGGVCTFTSHDVLTQLGLQDISKWCTLLMMVTFICFYRLLCYMVLRFKVCRRER